MEGFFDVVNNVITAIDDFVWGVPLMVLILFGGILLTVRLGGLQFRQHPCSHRGRSGACRYLPRFASVAM